MSLEMWSPPRGRMPVYQMAPSRKRAASVVPPAQVDQEDAELLLLRRDHRLGGGQGLQHDVLHGQAGAVHAADHVLHRGVGAGDQVHFHLEAHARHADRLLDAVLVVHDEGLGEDVDDLAVGRQVHGLGRLQRPLHVGLAHLAMLARHRDHAAAIDPPDVARPRCPTTTEPISTPATCSASATACRTASTVESMLTTTPLRSPREGLTPTPHDVQPARRRRLRDHAADLGGADVEARDDRASLRSAHAPPQRTAGLSTT